MNQGLIEELKALCAREFTGQIVLHVERGAVKMYETNERRRPRSDNGTVELTEVETGASSG